jgi:3'-phosphoadenosine 5'-phosphosulfate sulfotransferase (PAPS reductase)/FAD synthetase
MTAQLPLFAAPRAPQEIPVPDVLEQVLMREDAALFVSISGGKDGHAMLKALARLRRDRGWRCTTICIHAHLGRAEWEESLPHCERIAREAGLDLIVTRRSQGDLVQEIEDRKNKLTGSGRSPWPTATQRYCTADQKRDQLQKLKREPQPEAKPFWPDAANRYCTADQKRGQIDREIRNAEMPDGEREGAPFWPSSESRYCTAHQKENQIDKVTRRFRLVVSAMGMRAQESAARAKKTPFKLDATLTAKALRELTPEEAFTRWNPAGKDRLAFDWMPVFDWAVEEVWAEIGTNAEELELRRRAYAAGHHADALDGWPAHPAYVYGNNRVSCALCVLADANDLRVGAMHNPELYRLYVSWERETGFTFQHKRALGSVAPELLGPAPGEAA